MCTRAFEALYGCSHAHLTNIRREVLSGEAAEFRRAAPVKQKLTASDHARGWLQAFFDDSAEVMPDGDSKTVYHLPCWMTKEGIYNNYTGDLEDGQIDGKFSSEPASVSLIPGNESRAN